jgi:hypothetical protein
LVYNAQAGLLLTCRTSGVDATNIAMADKVENYKPNIQEKENIGKDADKV